jgi:negative modulator of initiation of replication
MRTIEIEDDVYEYLLQNTSHIGEGASEILRRLLGISGEPPDEKDRRNQTKISECIQDHRFKAQLDVVGKFLFILSCLYKLKPNDFSKVLALSGRQRKYFARSSKELENSGSSVFPKQIPGSPYWVVTNNDTPKKRRMLEDVLRLLEYNKAAMEEATKALV